jgi:proteasome lid subunit RPN8/RPN11
MGVTDKTISTTAGASLSSADDAGVATTAGAPNVIVKPQELNDDLCGGIDFAHLPKQQTGALSGTRTNTFQVIFRRSTLARIHKHGDIDPKVEICGVLVGEVYQDATGPYLLIDSIVEGISAKGSIGQVTFTPETWQHIQTVMDAEHPDRRIVGWYHTHPGHGIFLSEMDMFIHESFFNLPWQTAFVYDPQRHEEGIFGWTEGAIHKLDYLIEADNDSSARSDAGRSSGGQTEKAQAANGNSNGDVEHADGQPDEANAIRPRQRRSLARQAFLSIIGLLLFAATGYLLGVLILDLHIALPTPLHNLLQELKHSL